MQNDLKTTWGLELKIEVNDSRIERDRKAIILGVPQRDNESTSAAPRGHHVQTWLGGNEVNVLKTDKDVIIIAAHAPAGVFYGVQTLRQL